MAADAPTWWSTLIDLATLLTGAGATITAVYSWRLSKQSYAIQDRHNRLTQRPYPFLALADYEGTLRAKFLNDGAGPFIVKNVRVSRGNECKGDLLSWMDTPPQSVSWSSFTSLFEGRALLPNNELILLELQGDPEDPAFADFRDKCRERLSGLKVFLEYTDSYGDEYETYERSLDWFARDKGTRKSKKAS